MLIYNYPALSIILMYTIATVTDVI